MNSKAMLIILDGWGHGLIPEVSAIKQANTPFMDQLYANYPNAELVTFGTEVGLPVGQMGNSEVGHLNLGAGRIVFQELARINNEIENDKLKSNPVLQKALDYAKQNNKAIHLMGLVSDGGVHSHINHLKALCDIIEENGLPGYIHAFMDGRDTGPQTGKGFLGQLLGHIENKDIELSSVIGRYYAMDRDNRWERIKLAYDLLTAGEGEISDDIMSLIDKRYERGETDEFLLPIKMHAADRGNISEGDVVLFFNFRTDRPRQITEVLTQSSIAEHKMKPLDLHFLTMTEYSEDFKGLHVMYQKDELVNTLGEVLANQGRSQLRIAETEKYPHVTFFYSGGKEDKFDGESRILINSPKVATYDLQPEMSAFELRDKLLVAIEEDVPDFICLNFANTDMVGHTGIMEAAIKATEAVDLCLSQIVPKALEKQYQMIIIADHGNADIMSNPDGSPHTAHTTNMVPCIFVADNADDFSIENGKLADIAPTILSRMGIEIPKEMTGNNILRKKLEGNK